MLSCLIKERIEQLQPIPRKVLKILVPESVSDVGLMAIEANNVTAEEIPNEFLELCRVSITLKLKCIKFLHMKFTLQKIKLWDGECCENIVDKNYMKEVEDVLQGNLTISFVGGYNKGKSTLLNALLGDE